MATQEQDNKDVIQRFIREFVTGQHYDLGDVIVTEDDTRHDPASPESKSGPGPWVDVGDLGLPWTIDTDRGRRTPRRVNYDS